MTSPEPAADETGARLTALETEQQRQGGILEQILDRLPGKKPGSGGSGPAPDPDAGKDIGQLVREGVEQLEREKTARAKQESDEQARADHAERIARLEERAPRETVSTPAGRVKAAIQKWGFGIDEPRR